MEKLIAGAETQWGIDRHEMASELVFVSHETYTPARGGSASAEVFALRHVFGKSIDNIVIANTKGFTGHPMGVAIEDVVGMKTLETGVVPPVPNYKEVDPELGTLNLSKGGAYPVRYALRLGAGFGSQISMALTRWVASPDGRRPHPHDLGVHNRIANVSVWNQWLARITGVETPELEVVKRTLRVKDDGPAARLERASSTTAVMPETAPRSKEPIAATAPVVPVADVTLPASPSPSPPLENAPEPAVDAVQARVLQIVAEKTGYPPDMLDLDLDLEADLGIDTVKQAEMFATIRAAYDIPRDDNLQLRDYPTLAHTIEFVYEKRPDLRAAGTSVATVAHPGETAVSPGTTTSTTLEPTVATIAEAVESTASAVTSAGAEPAPTPAPSSGSPGADVVMETVLRVVSEQTGYPPDMLDLDLDLEADLGIDTVKQAEMFAAIRAAYDIPRDDNLQLRDYPTLAHTIEFVYEKRPDLRAAGKAVAVETAAAAPVTVATTSAATQPDGDDVTETVLRIVSEQTGYPTDMLDLDLDLEADLGIDTVKQAEMFAAIRTAYDIPRDDELQLRDYPTLAHTIQFVYDRRPASEVPTARSAPDVPGTSEATTAEAGTGTALVDASSAEAESGMASFDATAKFSATVAPPDATAASERTSPDAPAAAVPRRAPLPLLRPALQWCKPTGVTLEAGKRVLVMMDRGGVGKALVGRLQKLGVETLVVDRTRDADTLNGCISAWKATGPVHGVYWLSALDEEATIAEMNLEQWRAETHARVKLLYHTMRSLYNDIGEKGTFLVSAARLGGQHGYDAAGAVAPLGGAVTGFTKAFKREKTDALVKAVDFEASRKTAAFADLLIDETLKDPGVLEVGYQDGLRWTIGLADAPIDDTKPASVSLNADTVFVITGAAGGIVSAITADLATASGGTFHLLDLAPAPDGDDPEVTLFASDKQALKRDLFERLKAQGERVTPIMVEQELDAIERRHAAHSAITAIEKAGGTAHYHSVNMLDGPAMAAVMKNIADTSGRIDVLLHAAGLEISRSLPKKEPAEFERVFDVKSDGWFNLMSNLGNMPLRATMVFSSIAGRFGNMGQTDYSAANDLLCKFVSSFRTTRPDTHGVAIDWTAWGGIGMATRGSIPTLLENAGIDMIPPEAGIPIVRRELTKGGGEVVIAEGLGTMLDELDVTGGVDTDLLYAASSKQGVMTQRVVAMGVYSGLLVETTLDPKEQPFLYDHQIDGTPVLPGVMGIEALVEAAKLVFPELYVGSVENVEFAMPFKFYRGEPRTVVVRAVFEKHNGDVVADCCLVGERMLHGRKEPEITTHFTARVRLLAEARASDERVRVATPAGAGRVESGDIYKLYFHGPAYQVVENFWLADGEVMGKFNSNLPANHAPPDLPALVSPRLIELCFQTAGISEMAGRATMGLPHHIDEVEFLKQPTEKSKERYYAAVSTGAEGTYNARVVDDEGNVYLTLRGYRTMQLPGLIEDTLLQPLKEKLTEV
jgi:acyl carrier protein/NAD(P)-dependent dehydrogenase (short-subunit alcohol dehydrogenase family)